MDAEKFRQDARAGKIGTDRLVDLVLKLSRQLEQSNARIAELEKKLGAAGTKKVAEPFSLDAEEKRQEERSPKRRKPKKSRRGRIKAADKLRDVQRTEPVFPSGAAPESCYFSHRRFVWRLDQGQAVLVAYEIYRDRSGCYGQIPGVLGRSQFGIEIVLGIAYQVYVLGLSFDKVCQLMNFFQNLTLRKSQVDALLNQLSRHWEQEFDVLCSLLAHSVVVHTDETSWSINSVWAFLSEKARLLFYGVHKDGNTLREILDPATFGGVVVSDHAAVYGNYTHAQKCWAHLLRKAIKLTLVDPTNEEYRRFADRLLRIYKEARRIARDRRFSTAGREAEVSRLENELIDLCLPMWAAELPPLEGPDDDYRLLVNELMDLLVQEELFTFVTAPAAEMPNGQAMPIGGTNNEAERALRRPALARKTGCTNKTVRGARRRTVIVSVLESLRVHLSNFTLSAVIAEVQGWRQTGHSCFAKLLEQLKLPPPTSLLHVLFPEPET